MVFQNIMNLRAHKNNKSIAEYRADKRTGCYKESIMELIQKTEKHPPKGDIKRADFNR